MRYRLTPVPSLLCLLALLLFTPAVLAAAEFRLSSDTLLRAFERNAGGSEDLSLPIYEYLQADVGERGGSPLTFHLYGWGRVDAADSDYFDDSTAGELLYGFLEYAHPDTSLVAKLGRQYIFEGVARNESIDGLRISTDVTKFFSVSAYGGWPVALDSEQGRSGDSIFGGRVANHLGNLYEVGVSYKKVDNDGDEAEQMLGIDLSLFLPADLSVSGFSSYNLESDGWGEHSYELRASLGPVQLRPFFQRFRYEDYFSTGANTGGPFRFLDNLGETLTIFGADATWQKSASWELGLKGKYYDYKELGSNSEFFSGLATWHGEGLTQMGGELGRMEGDRAENDYVLARAYVYWDKLPAKRLLQFVTGDLVYVYYDEKIFDENSSFFLSLGGGRKFLGDKLEIRIAGDYSSDPYFDNDLRGWLLAKYTFER